MIYARYSSDTSREASTPAERHGLKIIAISQDAATTAASSLRLGYDGLLIQTRLKKPGERRELDRGLDNRATVTLSFGIEGHIITMIGFAHHAKFVKQQKLLTSEQAAYAGSAKVVAGTGFEPVAFRL